MLILASASPRRRQMFKNAGLQFQVAPADIDETPRPDETPAALVGRLACEKADAVLHKHSGDVVVAADTVVAFDDHILGKPVDMADARRMIEMLSGRVHHVYTGVCIVQTAPERRRSWVADTEVCFKPLSSSEIDHYLSISSPLDKAGAYAIQEHEALLVDSYSGLYSNVVGLPIEEVLEALSDFDIH